MGVAPHLGTGVTVPWGSTSLVSASTKLGGSLPEGHTHVVREDCGTTCQTATLMMGRNVSI
jgi:hypothetical protein